MKYDLLTLWAFAKIDGNAWEVGKKTEHDEQLWLFVNICESISNDYNKSSKNYEQLVNNCKKIVTCVKSYEKFQKSNGHM